MGQLWGIYGSLMGQLQGSYGAVTGQLWGSCGAAVGRTWQPQLQEGAADQHQLAEVELVGEALPLRLVQDALVVVVPAGGWG